MGTEAVSSKRSPELQEIFGNEEISFYVPQEFSTPGSLAELSKSQEVIKNEYIIGGKIPILNIHEHFGSRQLDFSGKEGEGLTFNEFFFAELEFKKRTGRFFSQGYWIKLSGSSSPQGVILLSTIYPDGGLACSYDDGRKKYPEPLSLPKP